MVTQACCTQEKDKMRTITQIVVVELPNLETPYLSNSNTTRSMGALKKAHKLSKLCTMNMIFSIQKNTKFHFIFLCVGHVRSYFSWNFTWLSIKIICRCVSYFWNYEIRFLKWFEIQVHMHPCPPWYSHPNYLLFVACPKHRAGGSSPFVEWSPLLICFSSWTANPIIAPIISCRGQESITS